MSAIKFDHFMEEVIFPLAEQTNAVIIACAEVEGCVLTKSLTSLTIVFRWMRSPRRCTRPSTSRSGSSCRRPDIARQCVRANTRLLPIRAALIGGVISHLFLRRGARMINCLPIYLGPRQRRS